MYVCDDLDASVCLTASLPGCGLPGGVVRMGPANRVNVWGNSHQWTWLLQDERAAVHLQGLQQASVTFQLHQNTCCAWQPASIPAPRCSLWVHDSSRGEATMVPCTTGLLSLGSMDTATQTCHTHEGNDSLKSLPNNLDLNAVLQASLRSEILGANGGDRAGLSSYLSRTKSIPVTFFTVQPAGCLACAKSAVCSVPADCSPGQCAYGMYGLSISTRGGALSCPGHLGNGAELSLNLSPWEETFKDCNHSDCLLRTTIPSPCRPRGVTSPSEPLPDQTVRSNVPVLAAQPARPHGAGAGRRAARSDRPVAAGAGRDADTSCDPIRRRSDGGAARSDGSDAGGSDGRDVGADTSPGFGRRELCGGSGSPVEQAGCRSLPPALHRAQGDARLPSALSAAPEGDHFEQTGYRSLPPALHPHLPSALSAAPEGDHFEGDLFEQTRYRSLPPALHTHLPSALSAAPEGRKTTHPKKRVSFFEEVTILIFDKEVPSQDLRSSWSSDGISVCVSTSGHAESLSAVEVHDADDELEWEDEFSAAVSSFPAQQTACRFHPSPNSSGTPVHPHSFASRRRDDIRCCAYSITHITDSDLD